MSPGETALSSVASGNLGNLTLYPLDNPLSSGFGWPYSEPHHCTPDTAILLWRKTHTFIFSVLATHPLLQPGENSAPHWDSQIQAKLPSCPSLLQDSSCFPCFLTLHPHYHHVAGVPLLCAHCKDERCWWREDCHSTPGRRYLQELISLECRRLKFSVVSAGFFSLPGEKDFKTQSEPTAQHQRWLIHTLKTTLLQQGPLLFQQAQAPQALFDTKGKVWLNGKAVLKAQKYLCCSRVLFKRAQTETQA